ncbi:MAG: hypothetical protein LAP61_05555 [Acidobacteriia bacterium]|nr:hypothetical protein [Terriglobia bacterium]
MTLDWKTNQQVPEDRTLALIAMNGKIVDIFVWFEKRAVFITHSLYGKGDSEAIVENKLRLAEIDGWIGIAELPLPVWIAGRA